MEPLRGIQGIIFELDSVLFNKSDWVIPGAEYAAKQMRLDVQRAVKLAHDYIAQHGGADPQIYNYILVGCGQFDTAMNIRAFTALVNQFQPPSRSIQLYPGVEETLRKLRRHFKLAVVTDGPPDTQKRKIIALGLQEIIATIIYTDEIEGIKSRLPDPRPLLLATSEMKVRPQQTIFVGHNPIKHFMRTRELGFITVRVLSGEYGRQDYLSEDHRAQYDLSSLVRLPEMLDIPGEENGAPLNANKTPTPEAAESRTDSSANGAQGAGTPSSDSFATVLKMTEPQDSPPVAAPSEQQPLSVSTDPSPGAGLTATTPPVPPISINQSSLPGAVKPPSVPQMFGVPPTEPSGRGGDILNPLSAVVRTHVTPPKEEVRDSLNGIEPVDRPAPASEIQVAKATGTPEAKPAEAIEVLDFSTM